MESLILKDNDTQPATPTKRCSDVNCNAASAGLFSDNSGRVSVVCLNSVLRPATLRQDAALDYLEGARKTEVI